MQDKKIWLGLVSDGAQFLHIVVRYRLAEANTYNFFAIIKKNQKREKERNGNSRAASKSQHQFTSRELHINHDSFNLGNAENHSCSCDKNLFLGAYTIETY